MTRAFVIRISEDVDLAGGEVAGRIEDVDSGRESRFTSAEGLLAFLQSCGNSKTNSTAGAEVAKGKHHV